MFTERPREGLRDTESRCHNHCLCASCRAVGSLLWTTYHVCMPGYKTILWHKALVCFVSHLYPFSVYPDKIVCLICRTWSKIGDFHFPFKMMVGEERHVICSPNLVIAFVYWPASMGVKAFSFKACVPTHCECLVQVQLFQFWQDSVSENTLVEEVQPSGRDRREWDKQGWSEGARGKVK